jgi:hypothetical protein
MNPKDDREELELGEVYGTIIGDNSMWTDVSNSNRWPVPGSTVTFGDPKAPILTITPTSFIFKGQAIDDAGEAHRAFMKAAQSVEMIGALNNL